MPQRWSVRWKVCICRIRAGLWLYTLAATDALGQRAGGRLRDQPDAGLHRPGGGLAGLAESAPWRAPGTRTAGLIQASIARILREVGRPAFIAAIWGENRRHGEETPPGNYSLTIMLRGGRWAR